MSHSEEPWRVSEVDRIVSTDGSNGDFFVADCFGPDAKANARRIVACVNACVGEPTEALEMFSFKEQVDLKIKYFDQANTHRELCVELQATIAKLHSQIREGTLERVCCGEPVMDNGYVCCGDEEAEWPDWALEAMRTTDEMNAKAEQVLGVKKL